MKNNTTPGTCIKLTDEEFFILVAILHQINGNIEQVDDETVRSHADFLFTGNSRRENTESGTYNVFQSLTGKVYDINIFKVISREAES